MPVKIFFCYAHEDEELLDKLKVHLRPLQRQGLINVWHDRDISAGTVWEREISQYLNTAQIILLLISPDFMNSDYCYSIEMKRALERNERGEACVIPVILHYIHWQIEPLSNLQALPTDAKPVTSAYWHSQNEAFFNVAEGIRKVVEQITTQSTEDSFFDAAGGNQKMNEQQFSKDFSVTTLKDGQIIRDKDVPLSIRGKYTLKPSGQVWVVLQDSYKHFYLQNPPIRFLDNGEWIAENIYPERGIEIVTFIHVSREGSRIFQRMVDNNEWSAFDNLPTDSTTLGVFRISRS